MAERLMRGASTADSGSDIGLHLMQIDVVLVGITAWVRQGFSAKPSTVHALTPHPRHPLPAPLGRVVRRLDGVRQRIGVGGITLGLSVTTAFTVLCFALLRRDFGHPLAPWFWLLALCALVLTFVGVGPLGVSPIPRDVDNEALEPPLGRREWIALGLILLVATAVRLWSLETVPTGPYTDEGDRVLDARHVNRGEPVNRAPFLFFGTGWWGVPSMYFWLVAQSMKIFGDTLGGARMVHALAGIGTVWYTYRIGRLVWSPRVGLLAAALLAVSDFAIQFSRTAGESTITLFAWTVCFYYLYVAMKTCRPIHWVIAGIAGGFTLLGYASGKLLPIFLVPIGLFLLGRWGFRGARLYLPGLVLMAAAMVLTYGPSALYVHDHPDAFYERYNSVSLFTRDHAAQAFATYGTHNWAVILIRQFGVTFSAFDTGGDHGPFYPTGDPILPLLWGSIWVLGTAYLVWRGSDARFAVLGFWLLGALAGAATTNDTPTLQRTAAIVPLLALIPAVLLVRLIDVLPDWRMEVSKRVPRLNTHSALLVLPWLLVAVLGIQSLNFYFGIYTPRHMWQEYSIAGRYAQTLDPKRDMIYQADIPERFWGLTSNLLLADRVAGRDFGDASNDLPLTDNGPKAAHFLVFPSNDQYLPLMKLYYPGGHEQVVQNAQAARFFTAYIADAGVLGVQRRLRATYMSNGGTTIHRMEARLGTLGARGDTSSGILFSAIYPLKARWDGGLVVPSYGTYRLSLTASAGAALIMDGQQVIAGHGSREIRVVLARGVHTIHLVGMLASAHDQIGVKWGSAGGPLLSISRTFLWQGPIGALVGESFASSSFNAMSRPHLDTSGMHVLSARRDGDLGYHNLNLALSGPTHVFALWRGGLKARVSGAYSIEPVTDGTVGIWLDGRQIVNNAPGTGRPVLAQTHLTAGIHRLEVRVVAAHDNQMFEMYWKPPHGTRELLPPTALTAARGGIWSVTTRPGVPGPDPLLLTGAAMTPTHT